MKFTYLFAALLTISIQLIAQDKPTNNASLIGLKTNSGSLYGTLLMPNHINGKIPVALIIAGSGPTDRDGNNAMMKNNSLKMLAESLANNGIASLRYDKRGIGESKAALISEVNLSFEDLIQDAQQWVRMLKENKNFSKIIIIGHSEGSLIGMNAAKNANGFISLAGAGRSADLILKEQLGAQPKQIQDLCFPIIDSLTAGKLVDNVNPMLNSLFRSSVQPYMISWFKHNPQQDIKQLKFPCLIIQGDNDLQVSISDARLLADAKNNNQLVIIEKMNHVFKIIDSGDRSANVAAYSNPTMPISNEMAEKISHYIKSLY
jgi:alpha/beta superfamily hydrolase